MMSSGALRSPDAPVAQLTTPGSVDSSTGATHLRHG